MKVLYYSTSYYADHGGSVQAIEFYSNLSKFSSVSEKRIFPSMGKKPVLEVGPTRAIKSLLKKVPFLQILSLYRRNSFFLKELSETISAEKPDVIIIQIDSNFLQIQKLKLRFPELLICTQVNGSPFDEPYKNIALKRFFRNKLKAAFLLADLNFFISAVLRDAIMGVEVNHTRDRVVHNGTDINKFKPLTEKINLRIKLNYPRGKFIVGYVGTLDHHKKMELLLESLRDLIPEFPDLELVIIGNGAALEDLKRKASLFNIKDNIQFKGWVDHHLINEHLNCFDVAIHHHANDYMSPLKIFEYLSAGIPVIGPDVPSVREIFSNLDHLLLTKPTKADIKANIVEVITNKPSIKKMSDRGMSYIQRNFTWVNYTAEIVDAIEEKFKQRRHA